MKIGITLTPNISGDATPREAVEHLSWAARYCDEHGFDTVWSTEHHFKSPAFSSSPSVILSRYASITERVQLGYAVAILPLHHPLRLAEEMAWVDQFSNGRLIAGVSPGWAAYEFDVLGQDITQRHERFEEGLALMRKALAGGKFSHQGKYWTLHDVEILPPAYQPGGPKFVVATTSEGGIKTAARLRVSPILGYPPLEGLIEQRNIFIEAARAEGVPEDELADLLTRLGGLRRVIIRDTDEEAEEEAIDAALGFSRGSQGLRTNQLGQPVEGILRRVEHPTAESDPRKTYAYTGTVWGSPDTVVEKLLALRDTGLGHLVIQFHSTTRNPEGTRDNIRRFATQVLPAYQAHTAVLTR